MNKIVLELLTKEIVILRTELQEARAEIELRGQSVATLSNYCKEDRETIAKLQSELQKFQSNFGHTNTQVEILQSINNGLLSELEELQSKNNELQKKIDAEKIFNSYYTELQHERDQLIREIEDRKFNYSVLEKEHTNLLLHRNSLQAENNKLILERDEFAKGIQELRKQNTSLLVNNNNLVKDRDQLRDDTARLAKGWDDCENKLKELQKTNPKDAKALKKLQEELQDTKSKLQLAQIAYNDNRKLIAERDELKARLESDQEFVRISKEESLNIRREFDRVSTERDQVQSELNTARAIIRRMRDEMKQHGIIAVIDDSIVREEPK